jgi:hypothetical protein
MINSQRANIMSNSTINTNKTSYYAHDLVNNASIPDSIQLFDFKSIVKLVNLFHSNNELKLLHKLQTLEKETPFAVFSPIIKSYYYSIIGTKNKAELVLSIFNNYHQKYNLYSPQNKQCYTNNAETLKDASLVEKIGTQIMTDNCEVVPNNLYTIPHILHHAWITTTRRGMNEQVDIFKKNHAFLENNFEKTPDWQHIFWLIDPVSTTVELKSYIESYNYEVRFVDELAIDKKSAYLINAAKLFAEFEYYALSSNIIRFVALREKGGVYLDGDYEIYHELNDIVDNFSSISGFQAAGVTCSAFIAGEPNHNLFETAYDILIRNIEGNSPDYIKYPCLKNDKMSLLTDTALAFSYFVSALNNKTDLHLSAGIISPLIANIKGYNREITDFDPYTQCQLGNNSFMEDYVGIVGKHHAGNSWGGDMSIHLSHDILGSIEN